MKTSFHEKFYSYSKYYDIAFDFRDVASECQFLEDIYLKHHARPLKSFVEFAAGPAVHCLEMAKRFKQTTAVDLSPDMIEYARQKAKEANLVVNFDCANMVTYRSQNKFDIAALLMDSTSYLLTNQQVISHLRAVSESLNPGGLYVLEMTHPKTILSGVKSTINEWEMERDEVKLKIQWGSPDDVFDPITQLTNVSVTIAYQDGQKKGVLQDRSLQRCFTATEFAALVEASGVFEIIEYYGGMTTATPFDNEVKAWRMVPVLRKCTDKK